MASYFCAKAHTITNCLRRHFFLLIKKKAEVMQCTCTVKIRGIRVRYAINIWLKNEEMRQTFNNIHNPDSLNE